jgi:hypothetical protein
MKAALYFILGVIGIVYVTDALFTIDSPTFRDTAPVLAQPSTDSPAQVIDDDLASRAGLIATGIANAMEPSAAHIVAANFEEGKVLQFVVPPLVELRANHTDERIHAAIRDRVREALDLGALSFDLFRVAKGDFANAR